MEPLFLDEGVHFECIQDLAGFELNLKLCIMSEFKTLQAFSSIDRDD
jgi:hypothetical protein